MTGSPGRSGSITTGAGSRASRGRSITTSLPDLWRISPKAGESRVRLDLVTRHAAAAVPEPATLLTLATGLLALGGAGRLRRRRKSVAA
ncbi:PEP-CTERM sorting domain-containing protein [Denitrobaculum tricleocarpae]|uniref:PEP-CTERM sorting domain-containing protein n=1 Tax=Denitrobaculum tricleocarpae TaxID=2591009 RepID=A0A545TLA0_9PROT|nr:PEP-CTERM sorting domain-containing protein [Denitrobaculum tricleocarpae]